MQPGAGPLPVPGRGAALLRLRRLLRCSRGGNPPLGDRGLGPSPSSANGLLCRLGCLPPLSGLLFLW